MSQLEPFELPCPFFNNMDLSFDEFENHEPYLNYQINPLEFSPSLTTTTSEDSFDDSHFFHFPNTILSNQFVNSPFYVNEIQVPVPSDDASLSLEDLEPIWHSEIEETSVWFEDREEIHFPSYEDVSIEKDGINEWSLSPSLIPNEASMDSISIQTPLILPTKDMEVDNQMSLNHLSEGYGESIEKEQKELAEAIVRRINEKVSPVGEIQERRLFYTFQPADKQSEYLKQESKKVSDLAFEGIYKVFPYSMFAHLTSVSSILEAMPCDAETIHIVDFDIGEGVQWCSLIEFLGRQQMGSQQHQQGLVLKQMALKLTSIRWDVSLRWRFEETKKQLHDHARSFGLELKIEEMELQNLANEIKKVNVMGVTREWLVFNCMWALPHMGRRKNRRHVWEFLNIAKESISSNNGKGVIIFGDGDPWEKIKGCNGFGSFFEGYMEHYQALMESMEWNFPVRLGEAKIAMESLFVSPYLSSMSWMQEWEETKEGFEFHPGFGLEGFRFSGQSLLEAKEMVREGESLYSARIEERESANVMVLEWRGTPLVRVSAWRSYN